MDISTGAGLVVLAAVYLAIHLVGFAVNWMLSESELTRRLKNDRDCAFIVWWGRERERAGGEGQQGDANNAALADCHCPSCELMRLKAT